MAEIRIINQTVDLDGLLIPALIPGTLCGGEALAHKFVISATRNGTPVALSGTVSGVCLRFADNASVALTGTIESGKAAVTLPATCYALDGRVRITIFVTADGATVASWSCDTHVRLSETDQAVDPGTIIPSVSSLINQIDEAVDSIPPTWTELSDEVDELKESVAADLYYHITDTDDVVWRPQNRVNSTKKGYSTNAYHYAALYKAVDYSSKVTIYPGSKISAKTGYTLDYSILDGNGNSLQGERNVAAGTEIALNYAGTLLLSVTDGTSDTSTGEGAKTLAKAGLNIDLIVKPIKAQVDANTESIAAFDSELYLHESNTDIFYWKPEIRVNSARNGYATGQAHYTGIYESESVRLVVLPGSTIKANTGYTIDYSIVVDDSSVEGKRGIAAGTVVTIEHKGQLLLSVTDGTSDTSTATASSQMAKAGLTIDLRLEKTSDQVKKNTADIERLKNNDMTDLVNAQRGISRDWHFPFINVSQGMGLGGNHIIPGTKATWSVSGTSDLDQKGVWMSDGVHPFKGDGVTDMYGLTIAQQLALVSPSFHDNASVAQTAPYWTGKTFLWMGTSIPAGSDPDAGEGTGSTYPTLVAGYLGAAAVNKSKGSSCVRVNASDGEYTGMMFSHFLRAMSRTVDEADAIAANWTTIQPKISSAPSELTETHVNTMKAHSFENLLLPYLDGTNAMPDLFVFDHGHNDVRPKGIDGENDLWINPSVQMIAEGILAPDTYMTANSYAKLKLALNDDLSGIGDLESFAASLNRNCFRGAMNFLITVILRYNPYARIAIIGDYN